MALKLLIANDKITVVQLNLAGKFFQKNELFIKIYKIYSIILRLFTKQSHIKMKMLSDINSIQPTHIFSFEYETLQSK